MLSFPLASQLSGGMENGDIAIGLIIMIHTEQTQLTHTTDQAMTRLYCSTIQYDDLYFSKLINYLKYIIILVMKNLRVIYGQLNYKVIRAYPLSPQS